MTVRHFLSLLDLSLAEANALIDHAIQLKQNRHTHLQTLANKTLAMIFEKSSTRTRVSFEAGMTQLGGHALFLSSRDTQLGRGEPIEDAARVISSMVDCVMIRTHSQETITRFAEYSRVPVINALSDQCHPCQLLADMQTYTEQRGSISGKTVAWVGDGNNMCHSYINAAVLFDFQLNIACPKGFEPQQEFLDLGAGRIHLYDNPQMAVKNADLITTDVWASMGQEDEQEQRVKAFANFQLTNFLMAMAQPDALFLHCLPAHRGEEVAAEVIDGPQSVVWQQAENRLHAQKALLEFLLLDT